MDARTTVHELDEVIERARSATAREIELIRALPACGLRRRKQRLVEKMRNHTQRLEQLRTSVQIQRRSSVLQSIRNRH